MRNMANVIRELATQKKAVILAHYYCRPEVQEAADLVGDSLALILAATKTEAGMIVLCGVYPLAETLAILCPDKTVIAAHPEAGCLMADMITAEALAGRKAERPEAAVLTHVNSPAAVKAESDVCCASSNMAAMLKNLEGDVVLMTPDRNLAAYFKTRAPEKKILSWSGFCPIHDRLRPLEVADLQKKHPRAEIAAHPKCRREVLAQASFVGSAADIVDYCGRSSKQEFIILAEEGLRHRLEKNNPSKIFHFTTAPMICPGMKMNSLIDIIRSLETASPRVEPPREIKAKALIPLRRMLETEATPGGGA
ncbi:MAG: quinolinate synthase NadA [Candidatus Adiutrix sp.]|jgi:quinolinate synthase|nr:quinolinate synthase NadA [Candidatus Adiutrix sp.]